MGEADRLGQSVCERCGGIRIYIYHESKSLEPGPKLV